MSWFAAIRTAAGGIRRHTVQALVLGVVLLISTASALVGVALLVASNAPFQHAFDARQGADLTVTAHTTANQLAATHTLPGVTATAGPFATATVQMSFDGRSLGPRTLAGRASPNGPVDDIVLSEGHWPDAAGQLVLDAGPGGGPGYPGLGDTVTVAGATHLTVAGFAVSITKTADGWVTPTEATHLTNGNASEQMLYRFAAADTDAQVSADAAEISRTLPARTVVGKASWLTQERIAAGNAALIQPFVVGFALLGLVMAVLITGNVVAGAVAAQFHRIGVLKSIGVTPAQVVAVYLFRIGWPALIGCVAGAIAGDVLSGPLLRDSSGIYGIGHQQVPVWAPPTVVAGMLVLTTLAAFGPALRAGRLSAVRAIAAGRAPAAGRGYRAHRLAARLRLPRPIGIGLAAPFARPARSLVTLAVIAVGATAVIFAVGLNLALSRVDESQTLSATSPVRIQPTDPRAPVTAARHATVVRALRAQPGTLHDVAVYGSGPGQALAVPGLPRNVSAQVFGGDADWLGYTMISGRWYATTGEVDVNATFLTDSGLTVGDTVTLDLLGTTTTPVSVRIVGEVFEPSDNPWLLTDASTIPALASTANIQGYDVGLRPGTSTTAYLQAINHALGDSWLAAPPQANQFYGIAVALVDLLAALVACAAGLGVLNTVLMTTRDKVHDLGVYKVLGMRPWQLLTMVGCQVAGPAVVAAVIAAPVGVALTAATVHAVGTTAHTDIPASLSDVLSPGLLALLSVAALAIAALGALLPGTWAARTCPATALRAE